MNKPAKILIVDDVPDTVEILSRQLKKEGYDILTANNGKDAIEITKKEKLDCILMDVNMPQMDGFSATKIIKSESGDIFIPIIIVTATKADTESLIKGLEIGADDYICIPCEKEEIIARVKSSLRIKQLHDELSEKNNELRTINKFMVNRELDMIKLKQEVDILLKELGRSTKYGY